MINTTQVTCCSTITMCMQDIEVNSNSCYNMAGMGQDCHN